MLTLTVIIPGVDNDKFDAASKVQYTLIEVFLMLDLERQFMI